MGRYLSNMAISPSTADGVLVAIDMTVSTVTGTRQGINLGAGTVVLRRLNANSQVLTSATGSAQPAGTVVAGDRIVLVAQIDALTGQVQYLNEDTGAVVPASGTAAALNPVSVAIGQGLSGRIHKAAIWLRPSGGQLPVTINQVVQEWYGNAPVTPTADVIIHSDTGQSLALGPNAGGTASPSGSLWRNVFNGGTAIRMITGLKRADGVSITNVASPLLQGYDTATPMAETAPEPSAATCRAGLS